MAGPTLPPTPASSTDIAGKKDGAGVQTLELDGAVAFRLPPAAMDGVAMEAMGATPQTDDERQQKKKKKKKEKLQLQLEERRDLAGAWQRNSTPNMPAFQPPSPTSPAMDALVSAAASREPVGQQDSPALKRKKHKGALKNASVPAEGVAPASASGAVDKRSVLPPPPTRSRKIIQMKPRTTSSAATSTAGAGTGTAAGSSSTRGARGPANAAAAAAAGNLEHLASSPSLSAADDKALNAPTTGTSGARRKQSTGSTTAAGRKIARKTAHSLIERRRRSKMNEEFGTLKDMIPACAGQEMHKLAILQASIEYMRYLEICVADLKAATTDYHTERAVLEPQADSVPAIDASSSSASASVISTSDDQLYAEHVLSRAPAPHNCESSISFAPDLQGPTEVAITEGNILDRWRLRAADASNAVCEPARVVGEASKAVIGASSTQLQANSPHSTLRRVSTSTASAHQHFTGPVQIDAQCTSPTLSPSSAYGATLVARNHHDAHSTFIVMSESLATSPSSASTVPPHAGRNRTTIGLTGGSAPMAKNTLDTTGHYHNPLSSPENNLDDREATAALLMLNSDQRNWSVGRSTHPKTSYSSLSRGMSVKDLLSS